MDAILGFLQDVLKWRQKSNTLFMLIKTKRVDDKLLFRVNSLFTVKLIICLATIKKNEKRHF